MILYLSGTGNIGKLYGAPEASKLAVMLSYHETQKTHSFQKKTADFDEAKS